MYRAVFVHKNLRYHIADVCKSVLMHWNLSFPIKLVIHSLCYGEKLKNVTSDSLEPQGYIVTQLSCSQLAMHVSFAYKPTHSSRKLVATMEPCHHSPSV